MRWHFPPIHNQENLMNVSRILSFVILALTAGFAQAQSLSQAEYNARAANEQRAYIARAHAEQRSYNARAAGYYTAPCPQEVIVVAPQQVYYEVQPQQYVRISDRGLQVAGQSQGVVFDIAIPFGRHHRH